MAACGTGKQQTVSLCSQVQTLVFWIKKYNASIVVCSAGILYNNKTIQDRKSGWGYTCTGKGVDHDTV